MTYSIIKFSAEWCGPCKQLATQMTKNPPPYNLREVDVDQDPKIAQRFGVRSVPTLVLVDKDEVVIKRHTGAMNSSKLLEFYASV